MQNSLVSFSQESATWRKGQRAVHHEKLIRRQLSRPASLHRDSSELTLPKRTGVRHRRTDDGALFNTNTKPSKRLKNTITCPNTAKNERRDASPGKPRE